MKVSVDDDSCVTSGSCAMLCPTVFDQDDDGIVVLLDAEPAPENDDAVRQAASVCPAAAIDIVD